MNRSLAFLIGSKITIELLTSCFTCFNRRLITTLKSHWKSRKQSFIDRKYSNHWIYESSKSLLRNNRKVELRMLHQCRWTPEPSSHLHANVRETSPSLHANEISRNCQMFRIFLRAISWVVRVETFLNVLRIKKLGQNFATRALAALLPFHATTASHELQRSKDISSSAWARLMTSLLLTDSQKIDSQRSFLQHFCVYAMIVQFSFHGSFWRPPKP